MQPEVPERARLRAEVPANMGALVGPANCRCRRCTCTIGRVAWAADLRRASAKHGWWCAEAVLGASPPGGCYVLRSSHEVKSK